MGSSHRKRGLEFLLVGVAFVSPHMPSSCIFLNNEMFFVCFHFMVNIWRISHALYMLM